MKDPPFLQSLHSDKNSVQYHGVNESTALNVAHNIINHDAVKKADFIWYLMLCLLRMTVLAEGWL